MLNVFLVHFGVKSYEQECLDCGFFSNEFFSSLIQWTSIVRFKRIRHTYVVEYVNKT